MKLRILNLAIIALLALSTSALAAEAWEKKLMDQGWVKIHEKPGDSSDITRYGAKHRSNSGWESKSIWIQYVHPDGKNISFQFIKGGKILILTRDMKTDGTICLRNKYFWGDKENCRTLWKNGDLRMSVKENGTVSWVFTIKKGNQENIKF